MAQFTQEQIQRLEPFEPHFRTAVQSGYVRGAGEIDKKTLVAVMEEATGLKYGDMILETCGSCVFRFVKEVGTLYYQSLAALKAEQAAQKPATAPNAPKPAKTTAKKQTAPKRAKKAKK